MKIALITGANKGIGLETAKQLSKKGVFVYLGCRDFEKGISVVKKLNEDGFENLEAIEIDVTKSETILSAKKTIENKQGYLDILINNAGIFGASPQNGTDASIENFKEVYETNVYGVVRVTQTFIELLKKSSEPRIVNLSSAVGSLTLQSDSNWPFYDYVKWSVYASSKAALNMYSINLAYELQDTSFKINAVCPGYTKTDFTNHLGGSVEDAGERIVKYALIDKDGPTGKFFSEENNPETGIIPW